MRAQVLVGSKQQIADRIAAIEGDVREAIVFIDEWPATAPGASAPDVFVEMAPHVVRVGGANYSRETLYADDGPK